MSSSFAIRAAALAIVAMNFCNAQNEPSFDNISDPNKYKDFD